MAKKKARKAETPKTTAQQLTSLIKSARDIMRKDKGLNGDLDRLPLLTWIMFLKFLDDRERIEEARSGVRGKPYKLAVESPYRWRDWAATKDGITGGEAKPLPYMLAQMNLLLHGLDAPAIEYGNSLAVKITEVGPRDQVDVILTNPPY